MGEFTKYKVILNGTVLPNQDREETIRALCDLFHSRPSYIEKLLAGKEISLKKEYTKSEAEKVCLAIRTAGAQCKLVAIQQQELAVLDDDFSTLSGLSLSGFGGDMVCPSCQQEVDSSWESCQYCGYKFVRKEADSGFSFGTIDESKIASEKGEVDDRVPMPHRNDIVRFIGPNADYYIDKFEEMGSYRHPRFKFSWHWPAFFAFLLWALYRKMWAAAALNIGANILLGLLTRPSLLWIGFALIWPICANYLYYRHVGSHIKKLDSEQTDEEKNDFLVNRGGVNKIALFAGVGLLFAITLLSSQMIATQMLEQYYEQHGSGSGEGDQLRGDGTVLQNVGDENSSLARTSKVLNVLANGLRVVIAAGNNEATENTIDSLISKSENEEIRDAWGNALVITREAGRVILLSPGPDGEIKNDDDVLQMINY